VLVSLSCASPAPTNFGHAVSTRKVAANGHTPADAKAIGKSRNVVTLTVTEFQECNAARAQESRQLSDESANQLQPIAAAIEREARLRGNAEASQVARSKIANARVSFRIVNIRGGHVGEIRNQQVEMRRIARRTRSEKRFGEIAVHEGDARGNTAAQRIRARDHERFSRDIGCNQA
jgi:hypothetical protein